MKQSEIWSSVAKWFDEKTSSPLYWTYLVFFIAWNWKFFQIIFLEDASLFSAPRIEYLDAMRFTPTDLFLLDWSINVLWRIIPPAFLSYLAIIFLPKVHKWAFEIHTDNVSERKLIYQQKEIQYQKKLTELKTEKAQARIVQLDEEKKVEERIRTQEEKWNEEFESKKSNPIFNRFQNIINVIFDYSGSTENINGVKRVDSTLLAFAHANGLINMIKHENRRDTIEFTEKGKFFVSKFLELEK